jgi:hypothetical protein
VWRQGGFVWRGGTPSLDGSGEFPTNRIWVLYKRGEEGKGRVSVMFVFVFVLCVFSG